MYDNCRFSHRSYNFQFLLLQKELNKWTNEVKLTQNGHRDSEYDENWADGNNPAGVPQAARSYTALLPEAGV